MKWRVIVRPSFSDGTRGRQLSSEVAKRLEDCGLKNDPDGATSTWEGESVDAEQLAKQFADVFHALSHPKEIGTYAGHLNHLWIYIDEAKPKSVPLKDLARPPR